MKQNIMIIAVFTALLCWALSQIGSQTGIVNKMDQVNKDLRELDRLRSLNTIESKQKITAILKKYEWLKHRKIKKH